MTRFGFHMGAFAPKRGAKTYLATKPFSKLPPKEAILRDVWSKWRERAAARLLGYWTGMQASVLGVVLAKEDLKLTRRSSDSPFLLLYPARLRSWG